MFCKAKIKKGIYNSLYIAKSIRFCKKSKDVVTGHCLIFSDASSKMSSLEKTLVHDITQANPPQAP